MNLSSIRWRLPLSYAAVALLAALALGSLMLLVLNGYYTGQERAFLLGNAEGARAMVDQILQGGQPARVLQDQVVGLAFLSQAQIRVLDANGQVLADSGLPDANQMIGVSGGPQGMTVLNVGGVGTANGVEVMAGSTSASIQTTEIVNGQIITESGANIISLPVSTSPYGYALTTAQALPAQRSAQVVSVPLLSRPGSLEISHGPAYGAEILRSVALAWLVASLAAVALAAVVGAYASRQVTQPVMALTEAARQMQYGNLASRATLTDQRPAQEFSALAGTFNQMAQRVEDTVSTLRAFVSDAAHELNTPLTALHTNLELALNEPDGGQRDLFLSRALEQNARLERLASGLLDLSRLEAAQTAPDFTTLDLACLAAESAERFASRAEQAERVFTLDLPAGFLPVHGNALQLQRMLDNLLENALKFTPPGGKIRLSLGREADRALLQVSDNGIGITADDLPHLCERFHRGRNSAEYPGTGLGLAIVKAIAELHGGEVRAESAGRGQGSTFSVRL